MNFIRHKLIIVLITILAAVSFFTIYHQTQAGILISVSDTMSRMKISVPSNHTIAFRLTFGTNVTENETITFNFSSGFAADLDGIDCGDIDLLDDGVHEDLNNEAGGCVATATEWGATVAGGTLTLTAPSNPGNYIEGSSDVVVKIGTHTTEEGVGNEQIVNPSIPGNYLIQIGGTFGDWKIIAIDIKTTEQVGVTAQVGAPGRPPDTTPPIIFSLRVENITQTSATILWETNEASTTIVHYGTTPAYGQTATGISFVTSHQVDLTGLMPDTIYHFQAVSADMFGNEARSTDQTFRTLPLPDTLPPIISNIQVINITENSGTVTWQTNEPATSEVEYGLTTAYELGTINLSNLVLSHSIPLSGLNSDTLYHFRVRSTDGAGNSATSPDQTFRTLAVPDLVPPVISNIRVINITQTSGVVTWQTDEPATSRLEYGLTTAYELGSIALTDLVSSHGIPLFGLTQNTLYHFRVSSTDAAGNTATSTDQTFQTLRDLVPPANVSNFRAIPGDGQVSLSWTNPTDPDFAGVKILRKTGNFPTGPNDGTLVYDGRGTSTIDTGLTNGITYYYAAFAYDTADNFASGALASATPTAVVPLPPPPPEPEPLVPPEPLAPPVAPPVEVPPLPPVEVPPLPPVEIPPITVLPEEKINLEDLNFYTKDRSLKLSPNYFEKTVRTLVSWPTSVSLPVLNLPKAPREIILTIGQSSYRLTLNKEGTAYETDFVAPSEPGRYGALVLIFYGSTDVIDFTLLVEPYGYVYEIFKDQVLLLEEASVTLYQLAEGRWQVWQAERFGQINPQLTPASGKYGFLVPPGVYYLEAKKGGYWPKKTMQFEVRENVININIELWRIPVLEPTLESLINIISFGGKVAGEAVTKVIDNPAVEETTEKVATPAVAAVALLSYSTAISLASLLPYLQFIFTQPILLLFPKRRKGWGVVYHSLSKMPVDLAIVRLYEKITGRLVQTRVTDREGRYSFWAEPGSYFIKVTKPNFTFPTHYLKDRKEDIKYLDIYHGEEINVAEKHTLVTPNIPIDPVELEKAVPDAKIIFAYFGRKAQDIVAVVGIILAAGSVVISPKLWMVGVLLGHCVLYMLFKRLARPGRPKSWGIVYEKETRAPVSRVIARIFETEYNKLLETQVTDGRGRYSFLVANNIYYVTLHKPGFKPKRTDALDLRKVERGAVVGVDVAMERA